MSLGRLALLIGADLLVGGLILWRILGPSRPPRWASVVFAGSLVLGLTGMFVGVLA